ncbi:hypothetical protein KIPB_015414, partial [Kipferlia bialata]|eukprot:g15414.t1
MYIALPLCGSSVLLLFLAHVIPLRPALLSPMLDALPMLANTVREALSHVKGEADVSLVTACAALIQAVCTGTALPYTRIPGMTPPPRYRLPSPSHASTGTDLSLSLSLFLYI